MNNFRHKNNVYAQGQEKLCYVCQKPGNLARSCPLANPPPLVNPLFQWPPAQGLIHKNSQMNRQSTVCYKCGNYGHIAKFCTVKLNCGGPTTGKETGNADQKVKSGSKIRLSTVSSADEKKTLMVETIISGKPELCVVDTGASISLIRKAHWQSVQLNDTKLLPSDIVAEAANNSPIGILGKTTLNVQLDENKSSVHEFYVATEMVSEVILGLDWLVTNKVSVDMADMVLKFPDGATKPLCLFDSTLSDPQAVVLEEDLVVPAKHEVVKTGRIRNPTLNESVLEPN